MCQLDHIDGDSTNHKLENLRMLCPNCHSQTETYASRNREKYRKYSKREFIEAVESSKNFSEVKQKLKLTQTGKNNETIKNLMNRYNLTFKHK